MFKIVIVQNVITYKTAKGIILLQITLRQTTMFQ